MQLICDKQLLGDAVANVSRAVSSKNTLAALEGVFFALKIIRFPLLATTLNWQFQQRLKRLYAKQVKLFCPRVFSLI